MGDLLIREDKEERHIGVVTAVKRMENIGSTSVFVEWADKSPHDYHDTYGYSRINVHNQHDLFTITKVK